MAAFKRFDPDPDITDPNDDYFGTGTWTYDDGTSTYGQGDRDEAMSLWQRPDTRIADASAADTAPMGPPPPPAQEALDANEPQADVGPPPMLARPPEPEPQQPSGITIPRESRIAYVHNNPGNLKFVGQDGASQGEPILGKDGEVTGHWAAFETPEEGVAALGRQVGLDASRGQTVREFISKYAPPEGNDTELYIDQAAKALGASPDAKLADIDRNRVVAFMARKESSTELGGTSLPDQPAARASMPGVPGIPGGLRPAVAEVRGTPLTPEQIQQRQQGVYDSTMTAVAGVQQAAEARQQGRQEALALVADQHNRFKADQQAQITRAAATRQEAEKNIQTALATQPDPGRVIKNMSTGQMVLGAVAMALGTIGNAMAIRRGMKTVNPAAWLEKAIEDDIQDQKQSKQSRIAHWTRIFDNAEMGERAARAELNTAVGQYMQYQAQQKVTDADIQAQAMQDAAALIGKGQQEAQALVDKENERLTIRYQPPDPGKAVDAVETFQKKLAGRKAYEESGATPEQLAGYDAAMGIPSPGGESTRQQKTREDKEALARKDAELTESEGKAESAYQTVAQLGTTVGLTRDVNTGKWTVPEGMGLGWKLGKMTELNAAREAAIEGLARLQTGAAISSNEESRFAKILGNENASLEELVVNLNALDTLIQSRRKQSRVGAPGAPSAWR